ncbi:MAG: glycosyltransferase family 4 protein [Pseudomonadota bacterium]
MAFYAPMKDPDHPVPSGDRTIARGVLAALARAGASASTVSRLRTLDLDGSPAVQADLAARASVVAAGLIAARAGGAQAWVTYHCHYKAPDLIGPAVASALGLPYLLIEPSLSPKRLQGPWAPFAEAAAAAIARADTLFWTTARDVPALVAAGHGPRLAPLPPFLDPGPPPARLGQPARGAGGGAGGGAGAGMGSGAGGGAGGDSGRGSRQDGPLALVTVAMMRPGDKLESYRRLARALAALAPHCPDWRLEVLGDGPAEAEVRALYAPLAARYPGAVAFLGRADTAGVRAALERADAMLWPGVGEGVGLAWLEAQAAGVPVVAEDGPAARDVVRAGRLAPPDEPERFAEAVAAVAAERAALSVAARAAVLAEHSVEAAAARLAAALSGHVS